MTADQTSPLLPAMEMPLWLRQQAQRARGSRLFSGRARVFFVAAMCIILGYLLTASLGGEPYAYEDRNSPGYSNNDLATTEGGVLEGPAGFNTAGTHEQDGSRGDHRGGSHGPSIKGALSDLGSAVGGRISGIASSLRLPGSSSGAAAKNTSRPGVFSSYENYNASLAHLQGTTHGTVSEQLVASDKDTLGARQRIGKVTIIFGSSPIYERAVRTHEWHDAVHNYPLHVLRHGIMDDVWSKPAYILSLLLRELSRPEGERLEWLLWVDADTILLNPYVPVEVFLPPSPEFDDIHLLVTRDWNGLNNGVFPVRVNQWSVDLFAAIVSYRYYRPDAPLVFRDQSAMDALLKEPRFSRHTSWAPQRWFNAYQGEHNETLAPFQVRRGDFLVHFAGVGDRVERMTYWLDRVEQHLPDWEMGVQHTSYPGEAREYWSQQRQGRADAHRALAEAKTRAADLIASTEGQLGEYGSRIGQGDADKIKDKVAKLKDAVGKGDVEVGEIQMAEGDLGSVRGPLDKVALDAFKSLTKDASEAIFSAEKLLLQLASDVADETVQSYERATSRLKKLVLSPSAKKADLSGAIDGVRRLTAKVAEMVQHKLEKEKELLEAAARGDEAPPGVVFVTATEQAVHSHTVMVQETVMVEPGAVKS